MSNAFDTPNGVDMSYGLVLAWALAASGLPAPSQMIETDTVNEKFVA